MTVRFKKGDAMGMLNMTPIIDVVFQLLIFFLVATRFAEEDRELDVTLPHASEAQPLIAESSEVFVNVDQQGRYYVDGQFRTPPELERVLRQAAANNPANQMIIIRADKSVEFEHVVTVMDLCNRVGIADYVVTTANE
ncbi:MAG: biopolymer transporter ExbD [Planctomycetes bacterium]|nr:biopolymer transporter ExbD [Planctomycetota bacterium]